MTEAEYLEAIYKLINDLNLFYWCSNRQVVEGRRVLTFSSPKAPDIQIAIKEKEIKEFFPDD